MSTHTPLHVLVSGAGIGGCIAAYWLGRGGHRVTVIERAPVLRKEGQTIDMQDEAIDIVKWMGCYDEIKSKHTHEEGVAFVDPQDRPLATFPASPDKPSFTNEIEIVRGELAMVFYEASKMLAEYRFGVSIKGLRQHEQGVEVDIVRASDGTSVTETFDAVIVAEGLYSRTRALTFAEDIAKPIFHLGNYGTFFSMPNDEKAGSVNWARWINFPRQRAILIRPDGFGRQRIMLIERDTTGRLHDFVTRKVTIEEQKAALLERFGTEDARWTRLPAVLAALRDADDLYRADLSQARCAKWSHGRVALVGDSAYCPSTYAGGGTSAAVIGAYMLASELHAAWLDASPAGVQHGDIEAAMQRYEFQFRPRMEDAQGGLPLWLPKAQLPETAFGIAIFNGVMSIIAWIIASGLIDVLKWLVVTGSRLLPESSNKTPPLQLQPVTVFDEKARRSR